MSSHMAADIQTQIDNIDNIFRASVVEGTLKTAFKSERKSVDTLMRTHHERIARIQQEFDVPQFLWIFTDNWHRAKKGNTLDTAFWDRQAQVLKDFERQHPTSNRAMAVTPPPLPAPRQQNHEQRRPIPASPPQTAPVMRVIIAAKWPVPMPAPKNMPSSDDHSQPPAKMPAPRPRPRALPVGGRGRAEVTPATGPSNPRPRHSPSPSLRFPPASNVTRKDKGKQRALPAVRVMPVAGPSNPRPRQSPSPSLRRPPGPDVTRKEKVKWKAPPAGKDKGKGRMRTEDEADNEQEDEEEPRQKRRKPPQSAAPVQSKAAPAPKIRVKKPTKKAVKSRPLVLSSDDDEAPGRSFGQLEQDDDSDLEHIVHEVIDELQVARLQIADLTQRLETTDGLLDSLTDELDVNRNICQQIVDRLELREQQVLDLLQRVRRAEELLKDLVPEQEGQETVEAGPELALVAEIEGLDVPASAPTVDRAPGPAFEGAPAMQEDTPAPVRVELVSTPAITLEDDLPVPAPLPPANPVSRTNTDW
ncbi:hypothetical protein BYT27DRAFT_7262425 [Phlegmacium glaucopus]|nr:hypothetical protein BYT27DRAFT_7262425 [Phlegmacium glaucopus]